MNSRLDMAKGSKPSDTLAWNMKLIAHHELDGFGGMGEGMNMQAAGCRLLYPLCQLAVMGVLALVGRSTIDSCLQAATISFAIVLARMMTGRRANSLAAAHGDVASSR